MFNKILKLFQDNRGCARAASGKCILVVEDSDVDRTLIEKTLQKSGYEVLTAQDGQTGFELAKSENPNLILLDCDLPVLHGIDVCKRLKQNNNTKNIPVIFLTGSDSPTNIVDCYDKGAIQYFTKPINPKSFVTQVEAVLKEFNTV